MMKAFCDQSFSGKFSSCHARIFASSLHSFSPIAMFLMLATLFGLPREPSPLMALLTLNRIVASLKSSQSRANISPLRSPVATAMHTDSANEACAMLPLDKYLLKDLLAARASLVA